MNQKTSQTEAWSPWERVKTSSGLRDKRVKVIWRLILAESDAWVADASTRGFITTDLPGEVDEKTLVQWSFLNNRFQSRMKPPALSWRVSIAESRLLEKVESELLRTGFYLISSRMTSRFRPAWWLSLYFVREAPQHWCRHVDSFSSSVQLKITGLDYFPEAKKWNFAPVFLRPCWLDLDSALTLKVHYIWQTP